MENEHPLLGAKGSGVTAPDSAGAHNNLGTVLKGQGRLDEAVACFRRALILKPDYAGARINLGNALKDQGRLDEAVECYRQALAFKPDYAEAHYNLGNALKGQGQLDEAAACFRQALVLKPDYAWAHNNLGNTLKDQGRLDEAVACFRRALVLKPDNAESLFNLGNAQYVQGRLNEAEASYRRALVIEPHHADALNNLALLMMAQSDAAMALDVIWQSLRIAETTKSRRIFVDITRQLRWTRDDSDVRNTIARALSEAWAGPDELARVSAELVKLNPDIGARVARASRAWPQPLSAQELFGANGLAALAADPLLLALLRSTQNTDIEMERFLTMARRLMLEAAASAACDNEPGAGLNFYAALTHQCFINEYVFFHTDDEIREAGNLRDSLVAALEAETRVPLLWVLAVAAYFPLRALPRAAQLLNRHWPQPIGAILVQQLREPEEESQLRAAIPRVTRIEDALSRLVQTQYEENPYPRWVKVAPPVDPSNSVVGYLCKRFPFAPFQRQSKSGIVEFLIAGCGTGQHSTEVALKFPMARILAVDLSLSSLAYARRKTEELGLTSIEYAQADILELGSLDRSFDVIEAVGVLHHLDDPFSGGRVLLSRLRPGGFMRLGLYSDAARRNITRTRQFIAEQGYEATADQIRRCRQNLLESGARENSDTAKSGDFFGISTCRDLLFHPREHRMTPGDIDAFVRENGLVFLGFEVEDNILHAYRRRFPDDPAFIDLSHWRTFESDNPDTFAGMYNFWIQKAG